METDTLVSDMDGIELHYKAVARNSSINSGSDKEMNGTPEDPFHNPPIIDKSQGEDFSIKFILNNNIQ